MPTALLRYPSLLTALLQQLQLVTTQCSCCWDDQEGVVSFYRVNDPNCIRFRSPIALRLATKLHAPIVEVTEILAHHLKLQPHCVDESALGEFKLTIDPLGWLHCQPSDRCLAAWLQQMVEMPPQLIWTKEISTSQTSGKTPSPLTVADDTSSEQFSLQYTHARCCALIRLAQRQGLLILHANYRASAATCQVLAPIPFPWLDTQNQLWLSHPAERTLIARLLAFPVTPGFQQPGQMPEQFTFPVRSRLPPQLWPEAKALSDAFTSFYRSCQIWEDINQEMPRAQARLGLILLTQNVLRLILQDLLRINAPQEL